MIVHSKETVTLIGGAKLQEKQLGPALARANMVIAADGGADQALAAGVTPDAVIGDMDSISEAARAALPAERMHHIAEQDSTDFDKCLRNTLAPLVLGYGFMGDRQDHQLACYNVLVRYPARRCVLVGDRDVVFLCPPVLRLQLAKGTRVSLFPMGAVEGASDGLLYPLQGLRFTPDGMIGTSNEALGPVELTVTSPKMLVILPAECLETVLEAFEDGLPRWD